MNEDNVKRLAESIDGAYPGARIFVNNLVSALKRESFIEQMTVSEGHKLFELIVDKCETIPTLGEIKYLYFKFIHREPAKPICAICDGNGRVTPRDQAGNRLTRTNGLHGHDGNLLEYTYVERCECAK